MADHCSFCDIRRPEGGTHILILGTDWLEFCGPCGSEAKLTNSLTGEVRTVREVFDQVKEKNDRERTAVE